MISQRSKIGSDMKESSNRMIDMELVNGCLEMEVVIKASLNMIKSMERESIIMIMVSSKEYGRLVYW